MPANEEERRKTARSCRPKLIPATSIKKDHCSNAVVIFFFDYAGIETTESREYMSGSEAGMPNTRGRSGLKGSHRMWMTERDSRHLHKAKMIALAIVLAFFMLRESN